MWDLSSPSKDGTRTPSTGRCILNHWTTSEAPHFLDNGFWYTKVFFKSFYFYEVHFTQPMRCEQKGWVVFLCLLPLPFLYPIMWEILRVLIFTFAPKMETACSGRQSYPTSPGLLTPRLLYEGEINIWYSDHSILRSLLYQLNLHPNLYKSSVPYIYYHFLFLPL